VIANQLILAINTRYPLLVMAFLIIVEIPLGRPSTLEGFRNPVRMDAGHSFFWMIFSDPSQFCIDMASISMLKCNPLNLAGGHFV